MKLFDEQVFDDLIAGTANTWYTPEQLNDKLATAELLALQACTTDVVSGSTLTVRVETSSDNKNWIDAAFGGAPEINGQSIDDDASYTGTLWGVDLEGLLGFVRCKITLGGTSPRCRLKLYVTGRSYADDAL